MNKLTKNRSVLALILLMSALLVAATLNVPSVNAQTTSSTYIYSSTGGTISANGEVQMGGASYSSNTNDNVDFTATPESGYEFLAWEYATAAGACTVTDNPSPINITTDGAIMALFIPTANTTAPSTETGAATVIIYNSIGGETNPTGTAEPAVYTNYTIGETYTFTTIPGLNFKFLYWTIATSTGNYYTTSTLDYTITESTVVMQAMFIPTDSDVTLPGGATPTPIPEFSTIATVGITLALVAVAVGTYAYKRKTKK
jgi:hypothetical protein